ncbi:unnamed protein product [Hydatigera taeniaeformis]|uniref:Kazal-like domain-containing protein n=1 Tax=Hydatigena taeniaeformis TaxID=6205 RepID=A0A0R3WT77_HYDTA|nr:unnamed protein product [Hydatigera taeniaeformis]
MGKDLKNLHIIHTEPVKLRHFRSPSNDHSKLIAKALHLTHDDEGQGEKPQQDGVNSIKGEGVAATREKDCALTCSLTAVQPVCGSDGNTYLNPCLLKLRRCMSKRPDELYVVHWGYCPARPPGKLCEAQTSDHYKRGDMSHT